MLLHQAVRRRLLGAMSLVVDRRAIWRPVGLPTDGLHALLTSRLWSFKVSCQTAQCGAIALDGAHTAARTSGLAQEGDCRHRMRGSKANGQVRRVAAELPVATGSR